MKWTDCNNKVWRLNHTVEGSEPIIETEHLQNILEVKSRQREAAGNNGIPYDRIVKELARRNDYADPQRVIVGLLSYNLTVSELKLTLLFVNFGSQGKICVASYNALKGFTGFNTGRIGNAIRSLLKLRILTGYKIEENKQDRGYSVNPYKVWVPSKMRGSESVEKTEIEWKTISRYSKRITIMG